MMSSRSGSGIRKRTSATTSKTKTSAKSKSTPKATQSKPTQSSKSSGPYDSNFQQRLTDGGVFPYGYRYPDGQFPPKPVSFSDINRELERPRASLSPTLYPADEKFD